MKYLFYTLLSFIILSIIVIFIFRDNDNLKTAYDFVAIKSKLREARTVEDVENLYISKVEKSLKDNEFFKANGFPKKVFLFADKMARTLSLYGEDKGKYSLIKVYPFTAFSGNISPKLREGDLQIPEGIYKIENFNPNSLFHLSMKINYPNDYDKAKGLERGEKNLGGDIMIHGRSVSICCIAIGDDAIEELFIICQKASKNDIDIIIAPTSNKIILGTINNIAPVLLKKDDSTFEAKSFPDFYSELLSNIIREMKKYEAKGVKF